MQHQCTLHAQKPPCSFHTPYIPRCHISNNYFSKINAKSSNSSTQSLPPYAQLSVPVYSLSTLPPTDANTSTSSSNIATLNLVTYASPISINPPRYALGLYKDTLSRENMLATGIGVLQLLRKQHAPLFHLLGKTSGRDVDKFKTLLNHTNTSSTKTTATTTTTTIQWRGHTILEDCCGAMELVIVPGIGGPIECGDHDVVICDVTATYTNDTTTNGDILYTDHLRDLGYMASI